MLSEFLCEGRRAIARSKKRFFVKIKVNIPRKKCLRGREKKLRKLFIDNTLASINEVKFTPSVTNYI